MLQQLMGSGQLGVLQHAQLLVMGAFKLRQEPAQIPFHNMEEPTVLALIPSMLLVTTTPAVRIK